MTNSTRLNNNKRFLPDLKCYFIYLVSTYTTANVFIIRLVFVRRHFAETHLRKKQSMNMVLRHCNVYNSKQGESLKKWLESHFVYYHDRCKNATTLNTIFVICNSTCTKQTAAHDNMQLRNILYGGFFFGWFLFHMVSNLFNRMQVLRTHSVFVYYVRLIVLY